MATLLRRIEQEDQSQQPVYEALIMRSDPQSIGLTQPPGARPAKRLPVERPVDLPCAVGATDRSRAAPSGSRGVSVTARDDSREAPRARGTPPGSPSAPAAPTPLATQREPEPSAAYRIKRAIAISISLSASH